MAALFHDSLQTISGLAARLEAARTWWSSSLSLERLAAVADLMAAREPLAQARRDAPALDSVAVLLPAAPDDTRPSGVPQSLP